MQVDINSLRKELKDILKAQASTVLFQSKPVLNHYLTYDILHYYLKGDGKKNGAMINFYRPHLFVHNLLKKKKVKSNGLIFIDALYNISGDSRKNSKMAVILPCPFSKDFEDNFFEAINKLEDVEFLLIDDISALQNYWDRPRIERFLTRLAKNMSLMGDPPLIIVADSTKDEWVLEATRAICQKVIEVNGFKIRRIRKLRDPKLTPS